MAKQTIYTVGGTVQAGGGIYIKRKADDELLELCRQGEFAFILSSRQVGKSSLMVRTARQLEKENIRSVTIDLSAIGVKVSADEWYLGILNEIHTNLDLKTDIFAWWAQYAQLGPAQRLTNFFRDVLLKEVNEKIVLFFDEIDSTLSIPFSDDFYIALRAVYNARSTNPDFKRLSFVLVGVAAPSDLISDNKRTPFNIGRRVEINDFTLAEALPLASGLGEQAVQALTWVFQYTGGHPYLTQRLCAHLAASKESLDEGAVANAVERLFTGDQGKQDNNLQFVRDMLSKRSPDVTKVLLIYRDIRSGKKVVDDERSITKAHLKLSGLVRSEKGILRVRNEIYNTVFNLHWVQENIPKNWQKVALISLSAALGILILGTLAVFVNDYFVGSRIDKSFRSFISAPSPELRLADLAEIYRQQGILSNRDSDLTASQLFYGLSTAEDQLALFKVYGIHENPALQDDLVIVISHLYITVANVDPEKDNTELLQTMLNALSNISDDPTAVRIKDGITAWIAGRKGFSTGDYETALENYNSALAKDPGNHAMLYERAKVYVALEQFSNALNDLDATIGAAKQAVPDIGTPTPTASPVPVSATPNATDVQTPVTNLPSTATTSLPTQINETPTEALTPTVEFTPTPSPVPTPSYVLPPKYESNFTTLIDIINAVQAVIRNTPQLQIAMQSNTDGTYTNLQSSGLISSTQVASTGLLADILERGYIMVATDPNYEPQSFLNIEGTRPADTRCPADALTTAEMQGFDVDIAIAIGDALGAETCFVTPTWDTIITGSWADKWDISVGSMIINTPRQELLDFSVPYYYTPAVVAVLADSGITSLDQLAGQAVCVGAATTYETWSTGGDLGLPESSIYASPPEGITVVPLETDQFCAEALASGREDFVAYVTSETVIEANIAAGMPLVKVGTPVFSEDIAAAFDKSSTLSTDSLRAEVDNLFTAMHNDGRLTELSNKWFGADLTQVPNLEVTPTQVTSSNNTPPPQLEITDGKGVEMVLIPAGDFSMGSSNGDLDEKPVHTVYLDAYSIDKFEVTNALYQACVEAGVCKPPVRADSFTRSSYYGNSQYDEYPVLYVNWITAKAYCEWRDASLPTEAQWEKAARGTDERIYPWGTGLDCQLANHSANNLGCVNGTSQVGSYESGKSPYGVYDMAGNVWEWVADWYSESYYRSSPSSNPLGPDSGQSKVTRGGSWAGVDIRASNRLNFAPNYNNFDIGFRCAQAISP